MTIGDDTLRDLGFPGETSEAESAPRAAEPAAASEARTVAIPKTRRSIKEILTTPIGQGKKTKKDAQPGPRRSGRADAGHASHPAAPAGAPPSAHGGAGAPAAADAAAAPAASVRLIGTAPRVDLLPPEVRVQQRRVRTARRLGLVLVGVMVLVGAGIGGTWYLNGQAQERLAAEQSETQTILRQQAKYMKVRSVKADVALIGAAQKVGASTEIDWKSYLTKVQNTLPAGVDITTVNIESASPLTAFAQATAPLQGARVATLSFAAVSPKLPEIPTWLRSLAKLPGYADGVPGTVTRNEDGTYTANVTVHINSKAFDERFAHAGDVGGSSAQKSSGQGSSAQGSSAQSKGGE